MYKKIKVCARCYQIYTFIMNHHDNVVKEEIKMTKSNFIIVNF